ncbi:hypothetical protein ACRS8P_32215 [Burkholderia cenocepacia]
MGIPVGEGAGTGAGGYASSSRSRRSSSKASSDPMQHRVVDLAVAVQVEQRPARHANAFGVQHARAPGGGPFGFRVGRRA